MPSAAIRYATFSSTGCTVNNTIHRIGTNWVSLLTLQMVAQIHVIEVHGSCLLVTLVHGLELALQRFEDAVAYAGCISHCTGL
jgi:hypothetical protein